MPPLADILPPEMRTLRTRLLFLFELAVAPASVVGLLRALANAFRQADARGTVGVSTAALMPASPSGP